MSGKLQNEQQYDELHGEEDVTTKKGNVMARLLYPGLSLTVAHIMYIGVACGTFDVLRTARGADAAIAALGIAYLVAVPTLDVYLLSKVVVAYVPYEQLGCQPPQRTRWLYPKGVWLSLIHISEPTRPY
eukprot:TRINITY_DN54565_c0_g1_i1.p1 TRINITY_DN54565_c0_g1~~TRINITY_DN54565_c0_g1_i1.p1  ORF type:complete len:129 (+),score=12.17 TRINITY_DN54565_c0_g1_i1:128-514(+)